MAKTDPAGAVLPLVMSRAHRYRWAYADETAGGWVVRLRGDERVLPKDVTSLGGVTVSDDAGREIRPLILETTSEDAYNSLIGVALESDPAAAAQALALHCTEHPSELRLCDAHGLPTGHETPEPVRPWLRQCRSSGDLSVAAVVTMMHGLMGLEDLAHDVAVQRSPRPRKDVERARQWDLLGPEIGQSYDRKYTDTGRLPVVWCKELIKLSLESLHDAARSRYGYRWVPQHGLRLVNHAQTDLALYVAVFASRALRSVQISDAPLASKCLNCGRAFQPRNSAQQFCAEPACRRAHAARNRRRERELRTTEGRER